MTGKRKSLLRELITDPWIQVSLALLLLGGAWFGYEIFSVP